MLAPGDRAQLPTIRHSEAQTSAPQYTPSYKMGLGKSETPPNFGSQPHAAERDEDTFASSLGHSPVDAIWNQLALPTRGSRALFNAGPRLFGGGGNGFAQLEMCDSDVASSWHLGGSVAGSPFPAFNLLDPPASEDKCSVSFSPHPAPLFSVGDRFTSGAAALVRR